MTKRGWKPPKSIVIFGHKIQIEVTDLGKNYGDSDADAKLIRLNATNAPAEQEATLFHECIHLCFALSGISYRGGEHTHEFEEMLVRCIENGIGHLVKFK